MTEQEFLEKRLPIWLDGDDLRITTPTGSDKNDIHVTLCKKYGYGWLFTIRGYYWPGSHVMLYQGDYDTPNCTTLLAWYLFSYFPDIKYVGFGCVKGKPGEIWKPRICIIKDLNLLNNDILNKQTEESV